MTTLMISMDVPVDTVDLWEKVWGSDGSGITYWCPKIRQANGEDIDLWIENEDGDLVGNPQDMMLWTDDGKKRVITVEQLAKAYLDAKFKGLTHCGGCSLDDDDACVGDIILQYAAFGDIIYG